MILSTAKLAFISLGMSVTLATGVSDYFNSPFKTYLEPDERVALVDIYNVKLKQITKNCDRDERCEKGKVIIRDVKNKQDLLLKLNNWIIDDYLNPTRYDRK